MVGQPPAGVGGAKQDLCCCLAAHHPRVKDLQQGGDVLSDPGHRLWAPVDQDDDGGRARGGDGLQQLKLTAGQVQISAGHVFALGFALRVAEWVLAHDHDGYR